MDVNSPIVDMVQSQVIAAIHKPELIDEAVGSKANIAFLLTGDLLAIKDYVHRLKSAGMSVFIHFDFIEGLSNHKSAIQYAAREWQPDGIITTRNQLIKAAKEEGLLTIQRIFLIDSSALKRGIELVRSCGPDAIEVLPGLMPRVIYELTEELPIPLIAGGLIKHKEEILEALRAGALATSVGDPKLWHLDL
ncbi:glycerol-3-phosphate responsive antiterminator [Caldalkalibacillus thermarum]|uniref:glycerol-3-phosphate responsive antiterminator n=1 Tax=Caldalkalibacillus thermarum TaxID=296745 RepID=UPI00166C5471|nr:glycerol-3-phosphate responsive antiterminator [Caldalkalibacillus thermarum]